MSLTLILIYVIGTSLALFDGGVRHKVIVFGCKKGAVVIGCNDSSTRK